MIIWENEVNILDYWFDDTDSLSDFYLNNIAVDTSIHFAYDQKWRNPIQHPSCLQLYSTE